MVNLAPARNTDLKQDERQLLPYEEPMRTWAGHGTGAPCNVCGLPVDVHDIEYEVELLTEGSVRTLRFHLKCYRVWESQD
jgi:hypothetical protein